MINRDSFLEIIKSYKHKSMILFVDDKVEVDLYENIRILYDDGNYQLQFDDEKYLIDNDDQLINIFFLCQHDKHDFIKSNYKYELKQI